jgi:hypothetical protein
MVCSFRLFYAHCHLGYLMAAFMETAPLPGFHAQLQMPQRHGIPGLVLAIRNFRTRQLQLHQSNGTTTQRP